MTKTGGGRVPRPRDSLDLAPQNILSVSPLLLINSKHTERFTVTLKTYFLFGCEKWTLGELINLIDLAVKNGLWAQAKAQAMAKAWQAIN